MPDRIAEPDGAPVVWRCLRCSRLWPSEQAAAWCCTDD